MTSQPDLSGTGSDPSTDLLRSSLGPIVFKIALEQQNIKEIFGLLRKFFKVFDKDETGRIEKKELATLRSYGLINEQGEKRLAEYKTAVEGSLQFREFAAFFATEILKPTDETHPKGGGAELDLPEDISNQLAPIAFRLDARTEDMKRIFALFKKFYDGLGVKDGKLEIKQLQQLVDGMFLEESSLKFVEKLDAEKTGQLDFESFLAFWIHHFVEELEGEEEKSHALLKSKLGPIIFKLALEQQNIKELFDLLQQVFNVLDVSASGYIERKEVDVLRGLGIISEGGIKRLSVWKTSTEDVLDLKEFVAFFSSEYVRKEFEVADYSRSSETDIPEKFSNSLAPLVFKLSARQLDLQRIFNLFQKFFEALDVNGKGSISKEELVKLREQDMLDQKEIDQLMRWDTARKGSIDFAEFLGFWVAHFVETDILYKKTGSKDGKEEKKGSKESQIQGIIYRLSGEREHFKRLLALVKKLFVLLDEHNTGINKTELSVLEKEGLLDSSAYKSLQAWKTSKEGSITLSELLLFLTTEWTKAEA